jgi:hypothetical protein
MAMRPLLAGEVVPGDGFENPPVALSPRLCLLRSVQARDGALSVRLLVHARHNVRPAMLFPTGKRRWMFMLPAMAR